MTDIVKKIDSISELSQSQIDRNKIGDDAFVNLMGFLNGYIQRTSSKREVSNYIDQLLLEKIKNDIEQEGGIENIPYGVIIKLEEILNKGETDAATPILKIIENATKQKESPLVPNLPQGENTVGTSITQEDYNTAKKILKFVDALQKTEFNDKEKM